MLHNTQIQQSEVLTYVFEAILAQLCKKVQEAQHGKPRNPEYHFIQVLDIDYSKYKDKFVEDKVPKLVFNVLLFRDPQLPEDDSLDQLAQKNQATIRHIHQGLQQRRKPELLTGKVTFKKKVEKTAAIEESDNDFQPKCTMTHSLPPSPPSPHHASTCLRARNAPLPLQPLHSAKRGTLHPSFGCYCSSLVCLLD